MKEEFLHWVWKNRFFDPSSLKDREAGPIEVIHPGEYNRDSGPDFFNTRLRIEGTEWIGNTEIHLYASDWYRHHHHTDHVYDNVILHLVHVDNAEAYTASGRKLVTSCLSFNEDLWDNYIDLVNSPFVLACSSGISRLESFIIRYWLHTLSTDRLNRKGNEIHKKLEMNSYDWEETLYSLLCRYFGFRVNADPFELLASRLPLKIIRKHSDNLFLVEALLFGTAGMLEEGLFKTAAGDDYFNLLCREYRILKTKYSLHPVEGWMWKFHRLRPANFPTLRISQLAAILADSQGLFSRILESSGTEQLRSLFSVSASPYWDTHYLFGRQSRKRAGRSGFHSADLIITNAIVPLLYIYGKDRDINHWCERALDILDSLPPEENNITVDFSAAGIRADSALMSQALIELRTMWCRYHRCLSCSIGSSLIGMGHTPQRSESLFLEP